MNPEKKNLSGFTQKY